MTGAQIKNLMDYYGKGMPNYVGDAMTAEQALIQINLALRTLSKKLKQWDSLITVTLVAGTRSHSLRATAVFARKVIMPLYLVINGNPLMDASGNQPGFYTVNEADRYLGKWREADTGNVTAAVLSGNEKITYVAPPSQAIVDAGQNYIAGTYLAEDLAALTDTPDIPLEFHECLAAMAAIRAAGVLAEGEIWNRIQAMNSDWPELIKEHAMLNAGQMQDWGSTQGYNVPDFMYT